MSALVSLLNGIVDYAGLFPPAGLDMDTVVRNYCEYHQSSQRWMLARLVVPASRLGDFSQAAADFLPTDGDPWPISALVPSPGDADAFQAAKAAIQELNQKFEQAGRGLAVVDAIETKASTVEEIDSIATAFDKNIKVFVELPHVDDPMKLLTHLAAYSGLYAKIRTGGVKPEMIPSVAQVATFINRSVAAGVGLKATAGLHHPIRDEFDLTYEPDSERATMHGFVNVFLAVCFAWEHQLTVEQISEILATPSAERFQFDAAQVVWTDSDGVCRVVGEQTIRDVRESKAVSFGSCSFVEPVQDLQELGFGSAFAEVIN